MRVAISSRLIARIVSHAAAAYPAEACGLLVGDGRRIADVVSAANVADDPLTEFEIDPALLLRAHREARGAGRQIVGWYHSHPNGAPEPSTADAVRAAEAGKLWLIVANGKVRVFAAGAGGSLWGRFEPVELDILNDTEPR